MSGPPDARAGVAAPWSVAQVDLWFDEFCDWARTALAHSAATLRGYRSAYYVFRHFLQDAAAMPGSDVRDRLFAIEAWVQWNRRRGLSAVSVNSYWRAVRTFFRFLVQAKGLENPFAGMRAPGLPESVPKAKSVDECRRILAAARNYPWPTEFERARSVATIATMMYAGLRRGEVLRLEAMDVDLADGTLRVVRGKGRYGGKDRIAIVPPELKYLLRAYVQERQRMGYVGPRFFVSRQGGRALSESQLKRTIDLVRRASGVPFTAHALRHSFVTLLLKSGTPIHVAKELAGHTDIATTANYLRVWDEEKHDYAKRLRLLA